MKVLIVDDEPDILQSIELLLDGSGVELMLAPSAEAALNMLDDVPDVVVTDFKMPGLDGIEFIQELHQRHPEIPAILMTAFADPKIRQRANDAGIQEFMGKPFDPDDLLQRIQSVA